MGGKNKMKCPKCDGKGSVDNSMFGDIGESPCYYCETTGEIGGTKNTESSTFEQAEKFYKENRERLIELIRNTFHGEIDYQSDYDQVSVWFDDFSICYQNSNMNGDGKGEPHWNNDGANDGLDKLQNILMSDDGFKPLIAKDEYWSNEYMKQFINDFCADFAEKHNIAGYFKCNNSD